jgi:hypothetical protein
MEREVMYKSYILLCLLYTIKICSADFIFQQRKASIGSHRECRQTPITKDKPESKEQLAILLFNLEKKNKKKQKKEIKKYIKLLKHVEENPQAAETTKYAATILLLDLYKHLDKMNKSKKYKDEVLIWQSYTSLIPQENVNAIKRLLHELRNKNAKEILEKNAKEYSLKEAIKLDCQQFILIMMNTRLHHKKY